MQVHIHPGNSLGKIDQAVTHGTSLSYIQTVYIDELFAVGEFEMHLRAFRHLGQTEHPQVFFAPASHALISINEPSVGIDSPVNGSFNH